MIETWFAVSAFAGLGYFCWLGVGWVFARRRCVVCGLHVRRSDWRATKVWAAYDAMPWEGTAWRLLGERPQRRGVAHRGCVVPSDAAISRVLEAGR